jgi:predicted transcriptional regulator
LTFGLLALLGFLVIVTLDCRFTAHHEGVCIADRFFGTVPRPLDSSKAPKQRTQFTVAAVVVLLLLTAPMVQPSRPALLGSDSQTHLEGNETPEGTVTTPSPAVVAPSPELIKEEIIIKIELDPSLTIQDYQKQLDICSADVKLTYSKEKTSKKNLATADDKTKELEKNMPKPIVCQSSPEDCVADARRAEELQQKATEFKNTVNQLQETISQRSSGLQRIKNDIADHQQKNFQIKASFNTANNERMQVRSEGEQTTTAITAATAHLADLQQAVAVKEKTLANAKAEALHLKPIGAYELLQVALARLLESGLPTLEAVVAAIENALQPAFAFISETLSPLVARVAAVPFVETHIEPRINVIRQYLDMHLFSKHPLLLRLALLAVTVLFTLRLLAKAFKWLFPAPPVVTVSPSVIRDEPPFFADHLTNHHQGSATTTTTTVFQEGGPPLDTDTPICAFGETEA